MRVYIPRDAEPRGLIQIVHGMCEYAERYEHFAGFLCSRGYAAAAHDHLGHGNTALSRSEFGFFGEERGWINLIKDTVSMTRALKNEFPGLPPIIYGHGMGSLTVRAAMTKYGSLYSGIIIDGTVGYPDILPDIGIILMKAEESFLGAAHHCATMQRFLNDSGIIGKKERKTDFDPIFRKRGAVSEFVSDDRMDFFFTAAGFRDLFTLAAYDSAPQWFYTADRSIPVLILGGAHDTIGGCMKLCNKMRRAGFADVQLRLYSETIEISR